MDTKTPNPYLADRGPRFVRALKVSKVIDNLSNLGTFSQLVGRIGVSLTALASLPVAVTGLIASWLGAPLADYVTRSQAEEDVRTIRKKLPKVVEAGASFSTKAISLRRRIAELKERGRPDFALILASQFGGTISSGAREIQDEFMREYTVALDELHAAVGNLQRAANALAEKIEALARVRDRDKRILDQCVRDAEELDRAFRAPSFRAGR